MFKSSIFGIKKGAAAATDQPKTRRSFSLKKFLAYQAVGLFLLWIIGCPAISGFMYDRLLFKPDRKNYDQITAGVLKQLHDVLHSDASDLSIKLNDGSVLDGWYFSSPNARKVVLINHGNGGSKAYPLPFIAILLQHRVNVMIYDYEGYGKSTGTPSLAKFCQDGLAAYDYLVKEKGYRPADIIDCGESIGTGVASFIAQKREVGGVLLISGFTSLHEEGYLMMPWLHLYPPALLPNPNLDNLTLACSKHPPLLIIHGDADPLVPCSFSQTIYERATEPKQFVLIKNATHWNILTDQFAPKWGKELSALLQGS